jgi:hypothetical protein
VGSVDELALHRAIATVERQISRSVNYTLLSRPEAVQRGKEKKGFLARVFAGSKLMVIGDANEIR